MYTVDARMTESSNSMIDADVDVVRPPSTVALPSHRVCFLLSLETHSIKMCGMCADAEAYLICI